MAAAYERRRSSVPSIKAQDLVLPPETELQDSIRGLSSHLYQGLCNEIGKFAEKRGRPGFKDRPSLEELAYALSSLKRGTIAHLAFCVHRWQAKHLEAHGRLGSVPRAWAFKIYQLLMLRPEEQINIVERIDAMSGSQMRYVHAMVENECRMQLIPLEQPSKREIMAILGNMTQQEFLHVAAQAEHCHFAEHKKTHEMVPVEVAWSFCCWKLTTYPHWQRRHKIPKL